MAIAITMGDSSGVGPEIILRAFQNGELPSEFIVVGDYSILRRCKELLRYDVDLRRMEDPCELQRHSVNVLDLKVLRANELAIGKISKKSGAAALQYVERATRLALSRQISAIVTQPLNKEAARLSAKDFTGHTEYIAQLCGVSNATMMLVSEKLIVTHVSTHVSLLEAIRRVKKTRVLEVIRQTHDALLKLRPQQRIAVAGLNPHAGESGAFGSEDETEIEPAVAQAKELGLDVRGPFSADTLFAQAVKGQYDAVVCMYHDQGHVPLKLLDFEGGVNVTLGLPIVRTSVDHGTAFDIAYQGKAFTRSLREACRLAEILARE